VLALVVRPSGKHLFSGGSDGRIQRWDLGTGQRLARLRCPRPGVTAIGFSSNGACGVFGTASGALLAYDLATADPSGRCQGRRTAAVRSLAVSPDGRRALAGAEDGLIVLWDLESGTAEQVLAGPAGSVNALLFTPDGRRALSGTWDAHAPVGHLILWDLASGAPIHHFSGHTWTITTLALTPDGRQAVSGSTDGTIRWWDLESGAALAVWSAIGVFAVVVVPGSPYAVVGTWDGAITLWDRRTGAPAWTAPAHPDPVMALAVSADGPHLVSGGQDGTLRIWPVPVPPG
jgi:WD40 repeat protein